MQVATTALRTTARIPDASVDDEPHVGHDVRLIERANINVGDDFSESGVAEIARSDRLGELAGLSLGGGGHADANPTGSGNQKRRRPVLPRCMLHPNANSGTNIWSECAAQGSAPCNLTSAPCISQRGKSRRGRDLPARRTETVLHIR